MDVTAQPTLEGLSIFENNPRFMACCDFGQSADYTAIGVLERRLVPDGQPYEVRRDDGTREVHVPVGQEYSLIRLERVRLRTSYEKIARGIVKLIDRYHHRHLDELDARAGYSIAARHPRDRDRNPVRVGLCFDSTGVGIAAKDLLVKEIRENPLIKPKQPAIAWLPVTIHGGARASRNGPYHSIPKSDLVFSAVAALQSERLKIHDIRDRGILTKELLNFRMKQNISTSHLSFEAKREGDHDDLVLATALGVLAFEKLIMRVKYVQAPGMLLGSA